jgi:uncharacterized protein
MKRIAFDLDDVLGDLTGSFSKYLGRVHDLAFDREEVTTYPLPDRISDTRFDEFYDSDEYRQPEPFTLAQEAVEELGGEYELVIISVRPETVRDIVETWLDSHFKDSFRHIHLMGLMEKSDGTRMTKGELARELGVAVFVEDSKKNAENIAAHGIPVVLLDCPWNQGALPESVLRVFSWQEAINQIRLLADSRPEISA